MRRYTAILLAAGLFLPFAGTWGYFQYEKKMHRHDMMKQVATGPEAGEMITLSFTREETLTRLKWEHDREFEYEGQMYDIVKSEEKGDTIVYHCVADHKESRLNREISKVFSSSTGQDPARKSQSERFSQFLKSLIHPQSLARPSGILVASQFLHPTLFCNYNSLRFSPPSPPPKPV